MKFSELKRVTKSTKGSQKWLTELADTNDLKNYEMAIRGPNQLVSRVFAKSEFAIEIDTALSGESAARRYNELWAKYSATAKDTYMDDGESPFKKPTATISDKDSIVVSLRRTQGAGTFWSVFIPLFVPRGVNIFFILPPVRTCVGALFPVSGDPDLFLTLNGVFTPTVAASIRAGTAVDSVSFTSAPPLFVPFVPFFRVRGFAAGFTGFFMSGF